MGPDGELREPGLTAIANAVAAAYAERSFRSVHVDTLEREAEGDYATRTEANVERLRQALAAD